MNQRKSTLILLAFAVAALFSCRDGSRNMPLAGEWQFALDPEDAGVTGMWYNKEFNETVNLPGSLQEQGKGYNIGTATKWTGQIVDNSWYTAPEYAKYREPGNIKVPFWLNPDKHYVGVAWYQKTVNIPDDWKDRPVVLELERTHWGTTVYVDGKEAGKGNALQTPHRYVISGLAPGEHRITLRVDNRLQAGVGHNAHSVSDHTQSNWNGVIGKLTLSAKPSRYIGYMEIYPDPRTRQARVKVFMNGDTGQEATLTLQARDLTGRKVGKPAEVSVAPGTGNVVETTVELGKEAQLWSEHTPHVYRMHARLKSDNGSDEASDNFGLREFKAEGTRFTVNGTPVFLRGTLECCVFPQTGYPPMTTGYWTKIYNKCKEYGLNHVRFHSWCPPKAAFLAADSIGIYLQVECGGWTDVGNGRSQDAWIREESDRILREYGNHPSFVMMEYGNEPGGGNQVKYLSELVAYWKNKDNRRVYAGSAGWPYLGNADFWNPIDPRIQGWGAGLTSIINSQAPRTDYDFAKIAKPDMPTVSHEVGQWCVYPNFKEIDKYTGVLKAKNFEIFRETLAEKGMSGLAGKFLHASGRLQTLCYKADIEAALRTPGFAGFQLLGLNDFPGQGTALVGALDAHWDDKGYVTGKEYRMFCNTTVPLARFPKMVWHNNEILDVPLELAHFGAEPLPESTVNWTVTTSDNRVIGKGSVRKAFPIGNCLPAGKIHCALSQLTAPAQLTVAAGIEGTDFRNQWNIWVYPSHNKTVADAPYITSKLDKTAQQKLSEGGSVLLLTYGTVPADKGGNITVGFSSIFWNTAWTRGQAPHTLGVLCDPEHPALADFPNEGVSDYQWWDLMSRCQAMVMDDFPADFRPVVHIIDDWFKNRKLGMLYEAKVGNGKLMVCSTDLENNLSERPAAAQFRRSLLGYMASARFNPSAQLTADAVNASLGVKK